MTKEESLFVAAGQAVDSAEQSKMFGKPCFKINGKAFVCFFNKEMVFKLAGDQHKEAIGLKGAQLFDPSGKGRAMKEWVQMPATYSSRWKGYAKEAAKYVLESA